MYADYSKLSFPGTFHMASRRQTLAKPPPFSWRAGNTCEAVNRNEGSRLTPEKIIIFLLKSKQV